MYRKNNNDTRNNIETHKTHHKSQFSLQYTLVRNSAWRNSRNYASDSHATGKRWRRALAFRVPYTIQVTQQTSKSKFTGWNTTRHYVHSPECKVERSSANCSVFSAGVLPGAWRDAVPTRFPLRWKATLSLRYSSFPLFFVFECFFSFRCRKLESLNACPVLIWISCV